ncbi:hypothetical protein Gasu_62930, partial [Galdieria sulphuraria]
SKICGEKEAEGRMLKFFPTGENWWK